MESLKEISQNILKVSPKCFYVELPEAPSINTYYRVYGSRVVLSKKGNEFKASVKAAAKEIPVLNGNIEIWILWVRNRKSGDLDNRAKPIIDALQGIAYENDKQVKKIHLVLTEKEETPLPTGTYVFWNEL